LSVDDEPVMPYRPVNTMNNTAFQTGRRKAGLERVRVHVLHAFPPVDEDELPVGPTAFLDDAPCDVVQDQHVCALALETS
jgi:hypothetical protein